MNVRMRSIQDFPHLGSLVFNNPHMLGLEKFNQVAGLFLNGIPVSCREGVHEANLHLHTLSPAASQKTGSTLAVIDVAGMLVNHHLEAMSPESGMQSYDGIGDSIDAVLQDDSVDGILLRIDSAGGMTSGVFDLADKIKEAGKIKPIRASVDDVALSAAYALASQTEHIYVSRTSQVGSVGVLAFALDTTKADEREGLKFHIVSSGRGKADLNPHSEIPDEAIAKMQVEADRLYGIFVSLVESGRPLSENEIIKIGADIVFGPNAVKAGLADSVRTFAEAVRHFTEEVNEMKNDSKTQKVAAVAGSGTSANGGSEGGSQTAAGSGESKEELELRVSQQASQQQASYASAAEITELCAIAGRPASTASEFIRSNTKPAEVRRVLMSAEADKGGEEILTALVPDNGEEVKTAASKKGDGTGGQLLACCVTLSEEIMNRHKVA